MMNKVLVVDDDPNILKVIQMRLEAEDYQISACTRAPEAVKALTEQTFDLALIDLKLPDKDGIELMAELHAINPELPVIILTAFGTIKSAVEAMNKGAYSYLTKPFDYQDLLLQIKNCLENKRLSEEVNRLRNLVDQLYGFENIIGRSLNMKRMLEKVALAAETDTSVYIEGESGTGKELVGRTLHVASPRRDEPFIAINCAAIPETLLESELFGYEKGAFTGAVQTKKGLLAQAHGGTFFLDEISDMPVSMQVKLLRVLQEREYYPLGSGKKEQVDIRLIATSNRDLADAVKKGEFRQDLFYRIYVVVIKIPPLRERKEDIPLLAKYFLKKFSKSAKKNIKAFSPEALQKMMLYNWPGNVRQLKNTIEGAVAVTTNDTITEDIVLQAQDLGSERLKSFKDAKSDFEKDYLVQLLELTRGNISKAANLSGKYRADLYGLLKKYELDPAGFRRD